MKDVSGKILNFYLKKFTFDNLFGTCENRKDSEPIIDEILNIVNLKSVCKLWYEIIKKYMGRHWGLFLKNTKPEFQFMYELRSISSLRHIIIGDITYVTRDEHWGGLKILALKKFDNDYVVRYVNFNLGQAPKINIAVDIRLTKEKNGFSLVCIPNQICFHSFGESIRELLFKRNLGPVAKFKECLCSENDRHQFAIAYPDLMKTDKIMFIPPLNKLEILFPKETFITYADVRWGGDEYLTSSPYYKSVLADVKILKDFAFFQGLCI
jgi:hypothetical protein